MLMGMYNIIMYIHAWASALLVLTIRAMPEPRRVGRVTGKIPTLFCILAVDFIVEQSLLGVAWSKEIGK